jgi:hypothetical protein
MQSTAQVGNPFTMVLVTYIAIDRDALRLSQRPASAAYIIVPALQEQAALYGTQDYRQTYGFGAISICEHDWVSPIRDWLAGEQSKKTTQAG